MARLLAGRGLLLLLVPPVEPRGQRGLGGPHRSPPERGVQPDGGPAPERASRGRCRGSSICPWPSWAFRPRCSSPCRPSTPSTSSGSTPAPSGRLGPLEWVLNTPSHHRVHHGRNPKYIDRNHAGSLIIWDRMFGTFQEEEEEPVYGITTPLASWNPVWANLHYWAELWARPGARRVPSTGCGSSGSRRAGGRPTSGASSPRPRWTRPRYRKYDPAVPPALVALRPRPVRDREPPDRRRSSTSRRACPRRPSRRGRCSSSRLGWPSGACSTGGAGPRPRDPRLLAARPRLLATAPVAPAASPLAVLSWAGCWLLRVRPLACHEPAERGLTAIPAIWSIFPLHDAPGRHATIPTDRYER